MLFGLQVVMYMDCLHGKWLLDMIKAVFSRRYLLQNCAVEVYTSTGSKLCHFVCTHSQSFFKNLELKRISLRKQPWPYVLYAGLRIGKSEGEALARGDSLQTATLHSQCLYQTRNLNDYQQTIEKLDVMRRGGGGMALFGQHSC